jgi:hypothetical protein
MLLPLGMLFPLVLMLPPPHQACRSIMGMLLLLGMMLPPPGMPHALFKGDFLVFSFNVHIQHRFICRPSDSTVSENAGI